MNDYMMINTEIPYMTCSFSSQEESGSCNKSDLMHSKMRKWDKKETLKLKKITETFQHLQWAKIARAMGNGRTAKQCRERYIAFLDPNYHRGSFTHEEDNWILQKIAEVKGTGMRYPWAQISKELVIFNAEHKPRVANDVKNRFHSSLNKKVCRFQGQREEISKTNVESMLDTHETELTEDELTYYPHFLLANTFESSTFDFDFSQYDSSSKDFQMISNPFFNDITHMPFNHSDFDPLVFE